MEKKSKKDQVDSIILHSVESLSDYIDLIAHLSKGERDSIWFRGHTSAKYRLLPSVLRETVPLTSGRGHKLRGDEILTASGNTVTGISPERMLDDFKRKALPFIGILPRNDFEWLFVMQHHGVPTRLLDWTTNALVALYFAVNSVRVVKAKKFNAGEEVDLSTNSEFREDAAAVFAINPRKINREFHVDIVDPVDVANDYERWKAYSRPTRIASAEIDTYGPICITAPQISSRIRAQSGLFSLHGSNIYPLDYYTVTRPLITKILIPHEAALSIRSQLHRFGITESFIFPDLEGVAKEVWAEEMRRYTWERESYLNGLDLKDATAKMTDSIPMKKNPIARKRKKSAR